MSISVGWLETILSYATPAIAVVALFRLWSNDLIVAYRYFCVYLLFSVAEFCVALFIPRTSEAYFYLFAIDEPIRWILQVCVLLELYALIVKGYPGISRTARKYVRVALGIAVVATLALAAANHESGPGRFPVTETFFLISRVVTIGILLFLVLSLMFLSWFPIPLNRNVLIYLAGYGIYFFARALMFLLGNSLGAGWYQTLGFIALCVSVAVLMLWAVGLSRSGEALNVRVVRWTPNHDKKALEQLESMNATLLRSRGR